MSSLLELIPRSVQYSTVQYSTVQYSTVHGRASQDRRIIISSDQTASHVRWQITGRGLGTPADPDSSLHNAVGGFLSTTTKWRRKGIWGPVVTLHVYIVIIPIYYQYDKKLNIYTKTWLWHVECFVVTIESQKQVLEFPINSRREESEDDLLLDWWRGINTGEALV